MRATSTPCTSSATASAARPTCAETRPLSQSTALAGPAEVRASRRRVAIDSIGIAVSSGGFGFVYGLAARSAGFSPLEAGAMSVLVFAGASQFAAVGYVLGGFSWLGVVVLTAFINARHVLYGAALAPYLTDRPRLQRAVMAHVLTDEAFALSIAHFRRIGRADVPGYWLGAIASTFVPWNVATLVGVTLGGSIPDPNRFGLDVIFPAAMGGLAVGLVLGQRELAAAVAGAIIGVSVSLAWDPAAGIVVGGLLGPLIGMAVRPGERPVRAVESGAPFRTDAPDETDQIDEPNELNEPDRTDRTEAGLP